MSGASDDFRWREDDAVIVPEQPAVAVYENLRGAIIIRQERGWNEDDDQIILIQPAHVETIARAMLVLVGVDLGEGEARPARRDATAAERQRRRRARDRHAVTTVTDRDGEAGLPLGEAAE